ncbi:MAG TPA: glycosyltransferase family 2 protein [Acetivibrio clariflavus]|nr:glycosyltransferase family 2 protein [Acetivibrio clariflavus]HPU40795.1 glycosyltransferase family 2 protein [Acetivibrio clariflavus]
MKEQVPEFETVEFKGKENRYCLCIPVINEGDRIIGQLKRINELGIDTIIDVILCDGGSTDGSTENTRLKSLGVNTLLVKKGQGKLSAQLRMGYWWALKRGYDGIVTVDGNGKDSVESIPLFIEYLNKGYDMVQGSRYIKGGIAENTPIARHLAVKLIHAPIISLAAGFRYTDTTNGFRAYSRRFLTHEEVQPFRDVFDTYELLAYLSVKAPKIGMKTVEIPVRRSYPKHGKIPTKISFIKGNLLLLKILMKAALGKYDAESN